MQSDAPDRLQAEAASDLVSRLVPEVAHKVRIVVNRDWRLPGARDTARLVAAEGADRLAVHASSGVAAAWGFHHYLKYWCGCHVSWDHRQLSVPAPLPAVNFTLEANDAVRYYQNVCEYGYSFVWWGWAEWERHIDWMALNGLNLILAEAGQEHVWAKTFRKFGMTTKEAQAHFTGPAFLPWNRMGNLNRWAGPLPLSWMERDRVLQRRILRRVRTLGMSPVAPAFAGIVPKRITELYPRAPHARLPAWGHFDEKYSGSSLLNMTHPLAQDIGRAFLKEYAAEFGAFRFFAVDTFNEMRPVRNETSYLRSYAAAVREMLGGFHI